VTYLQTRQSINPKEAIYITQRASKIQETATQTPYRGEMVVDSKVKLATETEEYRPKTVKMLRSNKLISQKGSNTINLFPIKVLDRGPSFPCSKIRKPQTKSSVL
jgi:hypothetical protein